MGNYIWLILGMAAMIFLTRYILFAFAGKIKFPDAVKKALGYIPPAFLTAIVLPSMLMPSGDKISLLISNPYLLGGIIIFITGFFIKNILVVSTIGIITFLICRLLIQ